MGEIESVGAIRGDLILDDSKWKRSVAGSLRDEMRLKGMFRSLRDSLSGLSLPLGMAGGAISGLTAKAVRAAMGVQESENLFEVSMGNMADSTRRWSEETAKALGMNANSIRQGVGTFNVMLKSMGMNEEAAAGMSKRLTTLAYDMASFYNLDPAEAFGKLQAGMAGEAEPLKRLGILINEDAVAAYALKTGLAQTKGEMTDAMKTAARFGLIMERTGNAQGDLGRTLGSATNQMRAAKEQSLALTQSLGQALIPSFTAGFGALNTGLQIAKRFVDQNQELSASFMKVAAGVGFTATALGTLGFVGPYVTRPLWGVARALFSVSLAGVGASVSLAKLAYQGAFQAGKMLLWTGGAALSAGKSILLMGATAIPMIRALGAAFLGMSLRAAGALVPFLPMAAAVAALSASLYVLRAVWKQNVAGIQQEAVRFGREVVQGLKDALGGVINFAVATAQAMKAIFMGMWSSYKWFSGVMRTMITSFLGWTYSAVTTVVSAIWKVASTFYGWIFDATKAVFGGVYKTISLYFNMIWTANKWIVSQIVQAWGDMFRVVYNAASKVAGAVLDAYLWVGKQLFALIKGYANFMIGQLLKVATFAKTLASTGSFGDAMKAAGDVSLSKDYLAEVPQLGRDYARLFMEGAGILKENVTGVFGDVAQAVKDQAKADFGGLAGIMTPDFGGLKMPELGLPGMEDAKKLLEGLGADGLYEKLGQGAQSMADKLRGALAMDPAGGMPQGEGLETIFSQLGDLSGNAAKQMKDNFGGATEGVNGLNDSLRETQNLMGAKVFKAGTLGNIAEPERRPRRGGGASPALPGLPTPGSVAGGGSSGAPGGAQGAIEALLTRAVSELSQIRENTRNPVATVGGY